ncbi:c-type cytochrome [Diaphorobacter ruginosibacter]|uniref:C-type cytochrome n=1 Tax=Diaphorobacter ruginosibacter TaxID=1715720 RepID=A0A7G9RK07_9BURK|nr:c-type cytochrome [Diaphorobacter ruginosibacter]QNN55932.1 c-type cytochrome [Diaphorobacter ruginosibacter]
MRSLVLGGLLHALAWPTLAAPSDGTGIPFDGAAYPKGVTKAPAVASQCLACHGPTGISQIPEWPNLAGQSKSYLAAQLNDFKSGKRVHPMMQPAIAVIDRQQIQPLAAWFSAQAPSVPKPPSAQPRAVPATAATCVACHDTRAMPANPNLRGQKAPYLLEQLRAFKNGHRKSETMGPMVQALSDRDMADLAEHFSQLAPVKTGAGK